MALQNAFRLISNLQNAIYNSLFSRIPENLAIATLNLPSFRQSQLAPKLDELINDAILWAVPKKRRSVEKRRNRKYGWPEHHWKILQPKTNILICTKCGSNYIAGQLCGSCYSKVMKETHEMQKIIEKELNIAPIEKEVVVLYEDDQPNPEFFEGKRIVEMKKKRPKIFSDNLMERSTQEQSKQTEIAFVNNIIKQ